MIDEESLFYYIINEEVDSLDNYLNSNNSDYSLSSFPEGFTIFGHFPIPLVSVASFFQCNTCLRRMLEFGISPFQFDFCGSTPIHAAALSNNIEAAELLVSFQLDINLVDSRGSSALHIACQKGYQLFVSFLINCGAELNLVDNRGQTPLFLAASRKFPDIVELLVGFGADYQIKDTFLNSPLHVAIQNGSIQAAFFLLSLGGPSIDMKNQRDSTVLHEAALLGDVDLFKAIMDCGANPTLCNADNLNILHLSVISRQYYMIKHILDGNFVPVESLSRSLLSPLHYAALYGPIECFSLLLFKSAKNINDIRVK